MTVDSLVEVLGRVIFNYVTLNQQDFLEIIMDKQQQVEQKQQPKNEYKYKSK